MNKMSWGQWVKKHMEERGWDLGDLMVKCEMSVSYSTILAWFRNPSIVPHDSTRRLVEAAFGEKWQP